MVAAAAGAGCFMFFNFCVIDVLKILFLVSETIRAAFVLCDSGRSEGDYGDNDKYECT